jgi:hypothetical protein
LLRQHPNTPGGYSRLVIEMAFHDDSRPWSWLKLLTGSDERAGWALGVLAEWVRDGDNAPDLLRCLTADAVRAQGISLAAPTVPSSTRDSLGPDRDGNGTPGSHVRTSTDILTAPRMLWTRRRMPMGSAALR